MSEVTNSSNSPTATVLRLGALGDMVMMLPMLKYLSMQQGSNTDLIAQGQWNTALFSLVDFANLAAIIGSKSKPYWLSPEKRVATAFLNSKGPHPVYVCEDSRKIHSMINQAKKLNKAEVFWKPADEDFSLHAVERWLVQAGASADDFAGPELNGLLKLINEHPAIAECEAWLASKGWLDDELVLLQPGNRRTMRAGEYTRDSNLKYWPTERWQAVIEQVLLEKPTARVLICGAPQELPLAEEIREGLDAKRVHAIANELPITRLVALCNKAHSLISVDTGPAHIAAAAACPVVTLYGATTPETTGPYNHYSATLSVEGCKQVSLNSGADAELARQSLMNITPAAVIEVWRQLLA